MDELGGEREAIAWLEREKKVPKDLPVRQWRPRRDGSGFDLWTATAAGADLFGFEDAAAALRRAATSAQGAGFHGLLALWQPTLDR